MSIDPAQALQGIRVVELANGMAGELVGLILAQFGADVIKVEPPAGMRSAHWDGFGLWNVGKRRVAIDLKSTAGSQQFAQVIAEADVLVRALDPAAVRALSVSATDVTRINPRLIDCTITGFDAETPYADLPGWDGLAAAKLGRGSVFQDQGEREGPVFAAVPAGAYGAAQGLLHGIFGALRLRERGASGAQLRTSILRGIYAYDYLDFLGTQFPDRIQATGYINAQGRRVRSAGLAFMTAATRDGYWIQFANIETHLFYRLMQALELQDLYLQPELAGLPNVQPEHTDRVREIVLERVRSKSLVEWQAIFDADGSIGYGVFQRPADVLKFPQIVHNGSLRRHADGTVHLAAPWRVNGQLHAIEKKTAAFPAPIASVPAIWPAISKDADQGASAQPAVNGATTFPPTGELLRGVTILELGSYLAGPYGGRILADYGARVIKIEPLTGDPWRAGLGGLSGLSCMWGKESISLNLKDPFGQEVLAKLVGKADALYHNFRPGVAERTGFGPDALRKINPQLVYVGAFPFGGSGPLMTRPAYDPLLSAVSGSATRQGGGALPPNPEDTVAASLDEIVEYARRVGMTTANLADPSAGMMVTSAVIYGLLARERTGKACNLETTMLGSCLYVNAEAFDPRVPVDSEISGDGLGFSPLYRLYKVRDGWVFLAAASETTWEALAQTYFADAPLGRLSFEQAWGSKEISAALEHRFAGEARDDLEQRSLAAGVPCLSVVERRAEAIQQPWLQHGPMVGWASDHIAGSYQRYGRIVAQDGDRFPRSRWADERRADRRDS